MYDIDKFMQALASCGSIPKDPIKKKEHYEKVLRKYFQLIT